LGKYKYHLYIYKLFNRKQPQEMRQILSKLWNIKNLDLKDEFK
ncbi:hypothetical protein LCGC14_1823090, partial [marine sediment metagenome]